MFTNFNADTIYLKKISFGMQLKRGIIKYCFQSNKNFIEWMSEDSIIIMNVEQHLLRSRRKKNLPKTLTLFKFHVHKFRKLGGKEKFYSWCRFKMFNLQMFPRRWSLRLDFFRRPWGSGSRTCQRWPWWFPRCWWRADRCVRSERSGPGETWWVASLWKPW